VSNPIVIRAVGVVRSPISAPVDDVWGGVRSHIDLDAAQFAPEALAGLDRFHGVSDQEICRGARHPRGRQDWPLAGIFAQRGKNRPNRLGVTVCRLLAVNGLSIEVEDLDAIDGTPVLDIKPYMREFAPRGAVHQPDWSSELMADYWTPART
jgi:tRNA (Thr-GGU) A37 N-methylase